MLLLDAHTNTELNIMRNHCVFNKMCLGFILCCFSFFVFAGNTASTSAEKSEIELIIERFDPSVNMGAMVVDLNTGKTLYSKNAKTAYIPASNMKLFSDAAALIALGPNYRFQTELSTNAHRLEDGTLNGNIYLYLPGDPSLTTQNIKKLFASLKHWGIKRIKGNIILVSERQY